MGRRKIEIQPITNERNRSVTFLKRKNGLFKKAHELGVLCSVDVAVIIFDERHGHDTKLYQYSSSDIRDIVQHHLRHNGERDTRGPADFSGEGSGAKNDAGGDADDDDDDGDAEEPPPPPSKKTSSTPKQKKDDDEFKPSARSARVIAEVEPKHRPSISNERSAPERSRSSSQLSTFPPLPPYDHQHPVSSDRLHPALHARPYQEQPLSKKQRLEYGVDIDVPRGHGHPLSAASSEDSLQRTHEALYAMYSAHGSHIRRPSEASHLTHYGPYGVPYPASPPPTQQGPGPGYSSPSFSSGPPDFGTFGAQISSWGRSHLGNGPSPGPAALSAFFPGTPGGALGSSNFEGLPFSRGDDGRDGTPNEKNGHGRDSFAHTFLEADQQQQQRKVTLPQGSLPISRGSTSSASFGIEWPSHRPTTSYPASSPTPPVAPPKSEETASDAPANGVPPPPDASGSGWLDLLSGSGTAAATGATTDTTETPIPTPRSDSAGPPPSTSGT